MVALSVLDLSVVSEGGTSTQALADTTRLAQAAERLGFVRFWVAEHHNMPTVASTSPAVLIAHLAGATERIRVGSGGVMLPNHAPLAIAEQFAMLEALHPGRIDLGIGRAPGTDPMTASAFGRHPHDSVQQFPRDVIDVMGMLGDRRGEGGMWTRFRATPAGVVDAARRPARLVRIQRPAGRHARHPVRLRPPLRHRRHRGRVAALPRALHAVAGARPSRT